MHNTLSDKEYERFLELNNEMQTLMTQAFVKDPNSGDGLTIAAAKQTVGRGVDMFLTVIGR
jgi:hypothetical protein